MEDSRALLSSNIPILPPYSQPPGSPLTVSTIQYTKLSCQDYNFFVRRLYMKRIQVHW